MLHLREQIAIASSDLGLAWLKKAAVVLAIAAAVVIAAWLLFRPRVSDAIEASGTIEATQSDVSPKVEGRLISLRVHDGQAVKKGQLLAVLEQVTPSLGLDQARAAAAAALAQVRAAQAAYDLQNRSFQTQLAQANAGVSIAQANLGQAGENLGIETQAASLRVDDAQAQLDSAQSMYERAKIELSRVRSLVATGDEPQHVLDDAVAQYRTANSALQRARDALSLAQANRRNVQIRELGVAASRSQQQQSIAQREAARDEWQLVEQRQAQLLLAQAQLAQARAATGVAQEQVRETRLEAPFDGSIVSHNFEVGNLIAPGAAVLTIADLVHPYLYVYVSETDLPHVKNGMQADVTIDGFPNRTFRGTVTEIGSTAEFTPENVQTKEKRTEYLVFRVKVQFTDTTGALKPGLPADARIRI